MYFHYEVLIYLCDRTSLSKLQIKTEIGTLILRFSIAWKLLNVYNSFMKMVRKFAYILCIRKERKEYVNRMNLSDPNL